jgi:NMD protein affecting ribosome stability and mRNA decay
MDTEKYNRSVSLLCPTCGSDQFEFEGGDEVVESARCTGCGREFKKNELIEENSENISEHVKEMGQEFTHDTAKEMRKTLKKAFRGNKHIKFK